MYIISLIDCIIVISLSFTLSILPVITCSHFQFRFLFELPVTLTPDCWYSFLILTWDRNISQSSIHSYNLSPRLLFRFIFSLSLSSSFYSPSTLVAHNSTTVYISLSNSILASPVYSYVMQSNRVLLFSKEKRKKKGTKAFPFKIWPLITKHNTACPSSVIPLSRGGLISYMVTSLMLVLWSKSFCTLWQAGNC